MAITLKSNIQRELAKYFAGLCQREEHAADVTVKIGTQHYPVCNDCAKRLLANYTAVRNQQ